MSKAITALLLLMACATSVRQAIAQNDSRTLHWRRLAVVAHLDADGRLGVRERHAMVFDGAWNGGARKFDIRPGQRLEFYGISRIAADGSAQPLADGDLDRVDHFAWTDAKTLRWRSRLPGDPPFVNQEIIYEIDYALSNILIPTAEEYRLDHDFAFPDRDGIVETFSLDLTADPAWQSATSLPLHLERANIPPGSSVVVNLPLRYAGAGTPGAVQRGVPLVTRLALALVLLGGLLWLLRAFFASEKERGRFAPLTPAAAIDAAWLREHLFKVPPEVVGAAWDTTTGAPEVAAMVARMVQEGKLKSRVEPHKRKHILHLELRVARDALSAEERKLVNALFAGSEKHTDTEKIRKRYSKSGFDPVALVRKGIEKQVKALLPSDREAGGARNVLLNVAIVMIIIAAAIAAFVLSGTDGGPLLVTPIVALVAGIMALVFAAAYRSSVVDTRRKAWVFVLPLLAAAAPVLAVVLGVFEAGTTFSRAPVLVAVRPGVALLVALIVLLLGITWLVLRAARTRQTRERLELRRTLAAARAYFAHELRRPQPALEDAWYPYLMAFGLGSHVDKWFHAFGPAHQAAVIARTSASLGAATSTGWSGGGPAFGGGGGFGGGGAGRSWASAVESFSAGVSAPSSSNGGGGGGGGGGGSSGGGGGGGW